MGWMGLMKYHKTETKTVNVTAEVERCTPDNLGNVFKLLGPGEYAVTVSKGSLYRDGEYPYVTIKIRNGPLGIITVGDNDIVMKYEDGVMETVGKGTLKNWYPGC